MIHEKSCGAVIFAKNGDEITFLIEKMKKGHTSICKGHVENNETEHETAAREIMEETGIEVDFIEGFRLTTEYSPYEGCMKEVVFFLAKAKSTETVPQEIEVSEIFWLPFEKARHALTYESDKDILTKAFETIKAVEI